MIYPGDIYRIVFPLSHADGSAPAVTTAPLLTILNLGTGTATVTAAVMPLVAGTSLVYNYAWNTSALPAGNYLAVVSYAADGHTFNGVYVERIRLGDTYVTGPVALDSTVAKDLTVAKDATAIHASDLTALNPNTATVVLAIKAKTDNLPAQPAAKADVTALMPFLTDLHDAALGTWSVDKTRNPKVLSFLRLDGSVLATFNVTEDNNSAARAKNA